MSNAIQKEDSLPETAPIASIKPLQEKLEDAIHTMDSGVRTDMQRLLRSLSPAEIANLLESTPPELRAAIFELVRHEEKFAKALSQLDTDVRAGFLADMNIDDLAGFGHELDTDDFADILQQLPETITAQILALLDTRDRTRLEKVLPYPEDSAGGLMNTDTITVRPRHSLKLVLRYLRHYEALPSMTDSLIVVNSRDEYMGLLPINRLLISNPNMTVREVMQTEQPPIQALLSKHEVAQIFTRDDLVSAPVVDASGLLLGRITIDDVVDVVMEEADHSWRGLSGINPEEGTFAPLSKTMRSRGLWLGINLLTAGIAAAVISIFADSIAKVVALAVLLPIVSSMGGVAGTQTLTLVVRGMAMNHVIPANLHWVIKRELLIGLLSGVLWALMISAVIGLIFQDLGLGIIAGVAVMITLMTAALAGATLPNILNKLGVDPAIAGGVILTTVTDVTGFLSFLGLATLFLF